MEKSKIDLAGVVSGANIFVRLDGPEDTADTAVAAHKKTGGSIESAHNVIRFFKRPPRP